jgi:NAD-dependent dihydropyrimidine dehydrogenase PreA subunit
MTVPPRIRSDHMASAHVHYFSGTGNTARAAELIAAELRSAGYTVTLHRVEHRSSAKLSAVSCEPSALRVFCFPIYACGIPSIMLKYLRRLPRAQGQPLRERAAVICTMGDIISYDRKKRRHHVPGFEGHALTLASGILRKHGYDVRVTGACSYPLNWTQAVNAPRPEIDAELRALGDSQATVLGKRIAAGERSIRRFSPAHSLWSVPFDLLFRIFGRRAMGKLYAADSDCNACGLCVRGCPARVIRLRGTVPARGLSPEPRPRWGWNCEACQRCINTCPKNAIQTSWVRLAAETVHALIPIPFLIWRLGPQGTVPAWGLSLKPVLLEVLFWLGAYVLFTVLLDEFVWLLGLIPGVRQIVEWSFTKHFRRYLEPHFRP